MPQLTVDHELTELLLALARYVALRATPVEGALSEQHRHDARVEAAHSLLLSTYQRWLLHSTKQEP